MIYDCFTFFNELDLLEIRLNELNDVVDYFVLVEGAHTYQNKPKPFYYLENVNRFEKFNNKIIRIEIGANSFSGNAWENEFMSMGYILNGLTTANDDDFIIIGDVDEIPKKESVITAIEYKNKPCCIVTKFHYFYLNTLYWLNTHDNCNWLGSVITNYSKIDKSNPYKYIRLDRNNYEKIYGGWHYSSLGNAKNALEKINSYAHTEFSNLSEEFLQKRIDNLDDMFGRSDVGFHSFENVEDLPEYVQENINKFSKYIR